MAIELDIDGKSIIELRNQLKGLRNDLAAATDPAEMARLAQAAGTVKDRMTDINEQVAIFSAGSKFEQAGIALGQLKADLFNLDFEGAAEKGQKLVSVVKSISFAEATKGLANLGSTFMSLGKALLTNPLFLIPAAITAILASLGLLGPIIDGVKKMFELLSQAVSDFLDYLGITNTKLDETREKQKAAREEAKKHEDALRLEAGQFSILIERLRNTNNGSKERKQLIEDINKQYGTTIQNLKDETKFQDELNISQATYLEQLETRFRLKANEQKMQKVFNTILDLERKRDDAREKSDKNNKNYDAYNAVFYTKEVKRLQGLIDQNQAYFEQLGKVDEQLGKNIPTPPPTPPPTGKQKTIELNKELANTLEDLTEKNNILGKSELELLLLNKERTDALIEEQYLKSTDIDKDKQRTDALLQNEINYLTKKKELQDKQAKQDVENVQKVIDEIVEIYTKPVPPLVIGVDVEIPDEPIVDVLPEEFSAFDKLEARWFEIRDGIAKGNKDVIKEITDMAFKTLDTVLNLTSSFNNLMNVNDQNRIKSLEGNEEAQEKIRKKIFERDKKLRIVQAIVDTASNVVTSVRNGGGIPFGIPFGAAAAAMGALQIAAISKAKYEGGSTSPNPGPNPSSSVSSTPSYNLFGGGNNQNTVNASTNQPINVNNQVMVKAYVSETDVTNTQERVARYKNSAEL
jgi:hypothetical protein